MDPEYSIPIVDELIRVLAATSEDKILSDEMVLILSDILFGLSNFISDFSEESFDYLLKNERLIPTLIYLAKHHPNHERVTAKTI